MPDHVRGAAAAVAEALRPRAPTARWTPPENLHCTVKFLGEVEDASVEQVRATLQAAARERAPLTASLTHAGAFPSARRARVLWVGLHAADDALPALASSIDRALEALAFQREQRPFRAHVTLARIAVPIAVEVAGVAAEPSTFEVHALTLFRSALGGNKPARYEVIERCPLLG